jgi:hypothetical protein
MICGLGEFLIMIVMLSLPMLAYMMIVVWGRMKISEEKGEETVLSHLIALFRLIWKKIQYVVFDQPIPIKVVNKSKVEAVGLINARSYGTTAVKNVEFDNIYRYKYLLFVMPLDPKDFPKMGCKRGAPLVVEANEYAERWDAIPEYALGSILKVQGSDRGPYSSKEFFVTLNTRPESNEFTKADSFPSSAFSSVLE